MSIFKLELKTFLRLLNANFTNVFQNLGDVCECNTQFNAYCADRIGLKTNGGKVFLAIDYNLLPPIAPAWESFEAASIETYGNEETTEVYLDAIKCIIEDEYNTSFKSGLDI